MRAQSEGGPARWLWATLVAGVVLAGCGADPDDVAPPTTAPSPTATSAAPSSTSSPTTQPAATTTTTAPSSGGLPELAPALQSADAARYTGIAQVRIGDSCTGTLVDTGVDAAPAYVLTNGHCAGGRGIGANDVEVDAADTGTVRFRVFADDPSDTVEIPVVGVPYSSMKGLDVTVARLGVTLGAAKAQGLQPLRIAVSPPEPAAKVVNVGIPVQGVAPAPEVLRRGDCSLGDQVGLIEFTWHFDRAWANDCPGIRGGSSGSPLVGPDGTIVAMINTTTAGANPVGGDCGLGKPCERRAGGIAVVPDRSYAVPVDGLGSCFGPDGVFSLRKPDCPLDPGVLTASGSRRDVQPQTSGAPTEVTVTIAAPAGPAVMTAIGLASTTDCTGPGLYTGAAQPVAGQVAIPVAVPQEEGLYLFCVARQGDELHAAQVVIDVDATPPQRVPRISVVDLTEQVSVEPIFSIPELSDYQLKFGPPATTDCADPAGYTRYRRIPLRLSPDQLPARVCVVGFDDAGNRGQPVDQIVTARG